MSPEEWLAQQGAGQKPTRVLSPEEWLAQQGAGQPTSRTLSPEEWLAQQDEKPTGTPGFIPSIVRGGRGLASLATDIIPAMVGKAIGQDEYAKQQLAEAAAYQKETERLYPAEVASYKDIKGVGDALTYVKEAIGEAIPSLIPSLVTGGVGGIAARGATAAATQAAEKLAAQEVARAATKNVLTKETLDSIRDAAIDAGAKEARKIALKYQVAGSRVGAAAQTIPAAYQDIYEATGQEDLGTAIVTGGFNAALEAILPSMLLSKATKTGIGPEELAAAWYKRAGKGAAKGFVTEGGTEALQEVSTAAAEKFVDNNQEFFSEKNFERFLNSGLKGGFGGAGITAATDVAFGKGPEAQQKPTTRKTILDRLAGEEDVARIDEPTGGEGAGVVGEPGAQRPAGRVGGIEPSGVVPVGPDVGRPDQRKEQPAAALTPEEEDQVSFAAQKDTAQNFADFRDSYDYLRGELVKLKELPAPTPGQMQMMQKLSKDLSNLVDQNAAIIVQHTGQPGLVQNVSSKSKADRIPGHYATLKNPTFDATDIFKDIERKVGTPRAMQGNLYGADPAKVSALLKTNLGLASQNPAKAIELLEARRAKDLADQASGKHDANWAAMKANYFGFNRGEAARNPTEISRLYMEQQNKDIDTAIKTLQDRMGQPRAMQGDMFAGKQAAPTVGTEQPESFADVFGTPKKAPVAPTGPWEDVSRKTRGDVELVNTSSLENIAQRNVADTSTPEYAALKASIAKTGIVDPITITTNSLGEPEVFEGNHRLQAAKELGIKSVPVVLHSRISQSESRPVVGQKPSSLLPLSNAIVDERGAFIPPVKKGGDPVASAGFKTLDEDNDLSEMLVGATLITGMHVPDRNKGVGAKLLGSITNWADSKGKTLVLVPAASPDAKLGGLSQEQLKAWYLRNGFEDHVDYMVRTPKVSQPSETTERKEAIEPVAAAPEAAPEAAVEKIPPDEAPKVTTEHVVQTAEGAQIKDFFDAIQPSSATPAEQAKHATPKNAAAGALLEFDITQPGETTSPGIQAALRYLVSRVGGTKKFKELLSNIKEAPAELQSGMFKRAGLPDLTTRRGMEEFSSQVDEYISNLPGKSTGVKISKQSAATPATGVFRGVMPYTEEVEQFGVEALEYAPFQTGEPRRPALRQTKKTYTLSDTKARSAVRVLREMLNMGAKLTRPARAAATYLQNSNREFLGEALRDVAFDIAMYETDREAYPANGVFKGEGGAYALDFQAWIEQNLDAGTVELLDDLIKDYKDTAANNTKFERLEKAYTAANEQAKVRLAQTEKFYGRKIPKTPKERRPASEKVRETEVGEQEGYTEPEINTKNIPREQMLYEVHPAIKRAIAEGDTTRVLELMAEAKGNPYYAALAQRLLDANVTAKLEVIGIDEMMPLTSDPAVPDTMTGFLVALKDLVITTLPKNRHAELVRQLESGKQRDIVEALNAIGYEAGNFTEGQKQLQRDAVAFYNNQYSWVGKYDPATDTMYMRTGSLTNHAFLHEALHAALSYLILNPDTLTGIRKQGYDQLNELFNHAKGMLSLEGLTDSSIYGLTDLHEFVSEAMTNPRFQATLRAIRYKASPYSLMNRFTQAVRKLFNIAEGPDSNVLNEVIFAADAMMMGGTAGKELMAGAPMALKNRPTPTGRPDSKGAIKNMMTSRSWSDVQSQWPVFYASLKANLRPIALGGLTTRQLADLVNKRIPQIDNFVRVAEDYLTRKNKILSESGDITKRWQRLQAADPDMSRNLGRVMHKATIDEIDPDRATTAQKNLNVQLMQDWATLDNESKQIYRAVRDFYEKRYSEYKRTLNNRVQMMRKAGVSEATISDIRKEFEKTSRKGPYFPLMRYGRFWYQVGKGDSREYYMFETLGEKEQHLRERLERNPELTSTLNPGIGDDYQRQMDHNARDSAFLKAAFAAVDSSNMLDKQNLKDELYQTWLANQPETSFRNRFIHRKAIEGFSQDALRNFASSSFHMAYQMSRFEYSPELFSQIQAAKAQLKMRELQGDPANVKVMRENNELGDYVRELDRRLETILNPEDVGTVVSMLSNVGFIYYLTSVASAATNVIGGMAIGLPTLIGHQIRMNPNMSYSSATVKALGQMKTAAMEIVGTGFGLERGPRLRDNMVLFPSLDRSSTMSAVDRAAYDKFVGDGLIDITAAYDQSGLASTPTESYNGIRHRSMQAIAALFHNAERFNREVVAMSAFRAGMEKRAGYKNQQQAFTESIADAKDVTNQSMFDYSTANKPRYMQHPIARVVLQFKQFPQQMTFYLARNLVNMVAKPTEDQMVGMSDQERKKFLENHAIMKREATARFVGTMGMTAIFAGSTGLWGFSTAAAIVNAVMNGFGEDDEEPFDFELEYTNWAVNTFGKNFGMFMARGAGNAAGIDLHSRVSLDGMWFRDGRKNLDEAEAWQQFLVDMLGPTAGLTVNMARAVDLYNKGQADRALETVAPGFLKQPLIAARYAREGVQTQKGDALVESVGPMDLLMQSLGFRPALIAEIQYYNITKKGQEQKILKERQNLLNLFGISFMANDADANEIAFEKIMKFNDKYTSARIPMGSITKSIKERMTKSAKAEHGMHIDKRLQGLIDETYIERLANEE